MFDELKDEVATCMAEAFLVQIGRKEKLQREGFTAQVVALEAKLAKVKAAATVAVETHDKRIAELIERMEGLTHRIEASVETKWGKVSFRSGYPRYTYDAKALNVLARHENPWLLDHRKKTQVKPSAKADIFEEEK